MPPVYAVLEAMATCAKPSDVELQALLTPVGEQLVAAGELAGGPRGPYQHAFKYVAEAMQTLTWVAYTGEGVLVPNLTSGQAVLVGRRSSAFLYC